MAWLIICVVVALGLYMAWNIGANDAANSMADAVGSGALSIRWAVVAAGVFEFAGAVLVGAHVTDTVRKGIVSPHALTSVAGMGATEAAAAMVVGMGAALLAAALWLNVATWIGMPVSTTHSIVGAVAGFGVVAAGWHAVHWGKLGEIVASWVISPLAGGVLAYVVFRVIARLVLGSREPARSGPLVMPFIVWFVVAITALATLYKGLRHITAGAAWLTGGRAVLIAAALGLVAAVAARLLLRRRLARHVGSPLAVQLEQVERVFAPLVILTSCSIAFAHGSNDVANAVGPLAAVVDIMRSGSVKLQVEVPPWVLALGGGGIVIGLATFGYRVVTTVGKRITQLTPSRGVAADVATCATVLFCTRLKLPVSTTHVLVGAIIGVGLARGLGAVNRRVLRRIVGSWLITVPACAVLSMVLFLLGQAFLFGAVQDMLAAKAG